MDNCTIDCIKVIGNFSHDQTCNFVKDNCNQDTIQFIQTYYCWLNQSFILLIILSVIVLVLVYFALNILTEEFLTPCVEEFIAKLNMSHALAGVTFLAFANGAPDIITAIVAGSSSSSTTALIPFGSLYGAAFFDMGFVLAMVIEFNPAGILTLKKREGLVPLGFFILGTVYLLVVSLFYQKMNIIVAVLFLSLYFIYIGCMIYEERKKRQQKKVSLLENPLSESGENQDSGEQNGQNQLKAIEEQQNQIAKLTNKGIVSKILDRIQVFYKVIFSYTVPPTLKEQWRPIRTIIGLIFSPFLSCVAFGLSDSFNSTLLYVPYAGWFSIPAVLLLIHTIFCIIKKTTPETTVWYSIYAFVIVVCWITEVCSILINLMQLLQLLTNINSVFLGLTVLAWANSIGDYLSITAFAKRGYTSTAVAGIFSGPLMNFLLGFGVTSILNSLSGEYDFDLFNIQGSSFDRISDSIVLIVISMTVLYMIWMAVKIFQKNGVLEAKEKKVAMWSYYSFVGTALLLSILTDFFRTVECDQV